MTREEFDSTLESNRHRLAQMYGDDIAHEAITSALVAGELRFDSPEKLRNYLFFSAKKDVMCQRDKDDRRRKLENIAYRISGKVTKPDRDAIVDVEKATRKLDPQMKQACIAYLLDQANISGAADYLDMSIPESTRRRKVAIAVERLLKGKLRSYAK